ncbi:hypothetical protein NC653_033477 [Populus alba x Populus x berolinensis]|uniref:Uncharacterized protein n=1 Tax=Populus alba x Populus x berolinensis TaxID=444605 RepID=A0AAD6LTQ6_9ROSI|nr:hypothetical protein NC653_033477 [Populus alba x Populus x berolinensis]
MESTGIYVKTMISCTPPCMDWVKLNLNGSMRTSAAVVLCPLMPLLLGFELLRLIYYYFNIFLNNNILKTQLFQADMIIVKISL